MSNKHLFASAPKAPFTSDTNEAGGKAYAFSPQGALAQYAVTGTFNGTFYAQAKDQLEKTLQLCSAVSPDFVAKTALYTRERGFMKDMPAFLTAYLAAHGRVHLPAVFPRVIDNGKMLRNFVQIIRSGVVGRKSLGTAPKRLCQRWFQSRSPEAIFRQSLGNDPSLSDVIKLVRPKPADAAGNKDAARAALYGWLIGKDVTETDLPKIVQAFEAFKKGEGDLPDVPFEMLTALVLDDDKWQSIANNMSWTQTRMNLNTLARHGVFAGKRGEAMASMIAGRLRNPDLIRRARVFPYQLMAAYKAASGTEGIPAEVTHALQEAMEIAIENVPSLPGKKIILCPDVSGSMQSAVTGNRKGATSSVRCLDVAALISAAFLRRNPSAEIVPFSDDVVPLPRRINPFDSVMTNAAFLASLPSGGTACSAPLRHLNAKGASGDLVIYVSDNQSWSDFGRSKSGHPRGGTPMAEEWKRFSLRNPGAKLVLVDLQPYSSTQVQDDADVLNIGGFSDVVFDLVSLFARGELGEGHWISEIEKMAV